MPSRDYFTYDDRPDGQSIEVGSAQSTPWGQYQDFFMVKGIILSEKPEGPAMLAGAYGEMLAKFEQAAVQLDERAHALREVWVAGPAAERFFWFAGATLYGLDHWVEHLPEKIDRLNQLVSDITDAHARAEELEQQFKAEYLSKIPAGGAFYGFPPDLSRNNPQLADDKEAKLKAQIAEIYAKVHEKYLRLIIEVGKQLGERFTKAAEWMGSAGKVPTEFQGPNKANPWLPYTPEPVSPRPMVFQIGKPPTDTPPPVSPAEMAPLSLVRYDGTGLLLPEVSTDSARPYGGFRQSPMPFPTESAPQHGFGPAAQNGFGPTTSSGESVTPSEQSRATGGGGAVLGRGFFLAAPPVGASAPPPVVGASSAGRTSSAGSGPSGATLAGRFADPVAPPLGESLPSALSARGGQPVPATDLPSPATVGSTADGPMGAPVAAATGWQQALSARAMMPPPQTADGSRSGQAWAAALGERRRVESSGPATKPARNPEVNRGGAAVVRKGAVSEPRPSIQGTVA